MDDIRQRSKRLFGNSYMLEVSAAVHHVRDRTNLTELIGSSGLSPSLYAASLHALWSSGTRQLPHLAEYAC